MNGQFTVFWAEEWETPDILKGPSCPRTGVMVKLSTSFSTALNGCSKALTVCTVLQKRRHQQTSLKCLFPQLKLQNPQKQQTHAHSFFLELTHLMVCPLSFNVSLAFGSSGSSAQDQDSCLNPTFSPLAITLLTDPHTVPISLRSMSVH